MIEHWLQRMETMCETRYRQDTKVCPVFTAIEDYKKSTR